MIASLAGCRTTAPPLPPVIEYRTVYVPVVQPDTTLGALRDLRAAIEAHGRVVDVSRDTSGNVRARFVGAPSDPRERVAFGMLQLAWMQAMLDRVVELVERRSEEFR